MKTTIENIPFYFLIQYLPIQNVQVISWKYKLFLKLKAVVKDDGTFERGIKRKIYKEVANEIKVIKWESIEDFASSKEFMQIIKDKIIIAKIKETQINN